MIEEKRMGSPSRTPRHRSHHRSPRIELDLKGLDPTSSWRFGAKNLILIEPVGQKKNQGGPWSTTEHEQKIDNRLLPGTTGPWALPTS